jgi:hypothetical protein
MKKQFCPKCGKPTNHVYKYDTYACFECDMWTENSAPCPDPDCEFCTLERPEKPSQLLEVERG